MTKEIVLEISWLRPLKLIGLANLLCGIIAFILSMILQSWVETDEEEDDNHYYMGLWTYCFRFNPRRLLVVSTNQTIAPNNEKASYRCHEAIKLGGEVNLFLIF